jgi:hypothetical protein
MLAQDEEGRVQGLGIGFSAIANSSQALEGENQEYTPFLSSTVTVSFWHFIRNLRGTISFVSILEAPNSPNELHDCGVLLYATEIFDLFVWRSGQRAILVLCCRT